jgi:hypothetical protein
MFTARFSLIFLSLLLLSGPVAAELVEIHLIDLLDEDRGYCLDIKGFKSKAKMRGVCKRIPVIPTKETLLLTKRLTHLCLGRIDCTYQPLMFALEQN